MSKISLPDWCCGSESVYNFVISIPNYLLSGTKLSHLMTMRLALTTDYHNIILPSVIRFPIRPLQQTAVTSKSWGQLRLSAPTGQQAS